MSYIFINVYVLYVGVIIYIYVCVNLFAHLEMYYICRLQTARNQLFI